MRLLRARLAALAGSPLPGERPAHGAPGHGLGCSGWPPPKPLIPPPLTLQEQLRVQMQTNQDLTEDLLVSWSARERLTEEVRLRLGLRSG